MELYKILALIGALFSLIAALQFYQIVKQMKKLKIGDMLSIEFVAEVRKKLTVYIILFGIGSFLAIIAIFIRPY